MSTLRSQGVACEALEHGANNWTTKTAVLIRCKGADKRGDMIFNCSEPLFGA